MSIADAFDTQTSCRLLQIEERATTSAKLSQLANIWIKISEAQERKLLVGMVLVRGNWQSHMNVQSFTMGLCRRLEWLFGITCRVKKRGRATQIEEIEDLKA